MKHLLVWLFVIGLHAQNPSVKTFFEDLPHASKAPTFEEVLAAVDQIQVLGKQDAQNLLPVLFNALKTTDSEAVGMPVCQAFYALSRRPDSGDLLRPHLAEIFTLYGRGDRRYKSTVNLVFANAKPPAPEAAALLSTFVTSKAGTAAEKVDALAVLLDIQHDNPHAEEVRLGVLNLPMDPNTRRAALFAAARPGASKEVTDRIARDLGNTSEEVQIGAIQALALLGNSTVNQYRLELIRTTQYGATPTVKRLAQMCSTRRT